jgi:hypothetical protein
MVPIQPEWNLHYFRWVIGDGNPERHVGEVFDWFATTFWSEATLAKADEHEKTAAPIADNAYRVAAEVVYISTDALQDACVIDFGIRAISDLEILAPGCREGDYVTGQVRLELPLCTKISPHDLTRRWRVNRISADLTPYVPHPTHGYLMRDSSQIQYKDVAGTDSVSAECYVLHCSEVLLPA